MWKESFLHVVSAGEFCRGQWVVTEVEDGKVPWGPEEFCLPERDTESCRPTFIFCSRRLCAEDEC